MQWIHKGSYHLWAPRFFGVLHPGYLQLFETVPNFLSLKSGRVSPGDWLIHFEQLDVESQHVLVVLNRTGV